MSSIFLSYDRQDSHIAERMVRQLEQVGLDVWWDRSSLSPGQSFEDSIDQAIAAADHVAVLWSEASIRSSWVRAEASEGQVRGILIPVLIQQTRPPLSFRGLHTLDLTRWAAGDSEPLPDDFLKACRKAELRIGYQYDLTVCIDLNPNMRNYLRRVKREALEFQPNLNAAAERLGKNIACSSAKLIGYSSPGGPLTVTKFHDLATAEDEFVNAVSGLKVEESELVDRSSVSMGLKALELAIRGPWPRLRAQRRRQIIIVWTDRGSAQGPVGGYGAVSFDELTDLWEGGEFMLLDSKRLMMYGPDAYPWNNVANFWDNALHLPLPAGEGMQGVELQEVIDTMVNSI